MPLISICLKYVIYNSSIYQMEHNINGSSDTWQCYQQRQYPDNHWTLWHHGERSFHATRRGHHSAYRWDNSREQ